MAGTEESLRNAASKLAGLVRGQEKAPDVQSATVTRIDDDGTVWVAIAGSGTETPVRAGMAAGVGDRVSVRLAGGTATITDNTTRPATDDTTAISALGEAGAARMAAMDAQDVADQAAEVAGAIGQHFWADEGGVHVSTDEGDQFGQRNSIFNSLGLIFREGVNNLMALVSGSYIGGAASDRGLAIFDGLGNAASNVVAWFGRNGIRIGRASAQHIELTAQGMSITNGSTAGTVNGVDVVATNTTANAARSTANSAASAASAAQSTANGAATAASNAQTTANGAATAASNAQTTANGAATAASNAQTTANGAATAASNAQSTADAALRMAADSAYNMLTDWNAPSLAKVDGPAARYFSDNSANRTVEYIQVSDPPEPGIAYGARVTSQGAQANNTTKSAVCFYASSTDVPMSEGQSYTVSFWARCTSGACAYYCQAGSSPYAQKNGSNTYSDENALGTQWQRIEWTFQYTAAGMGGGGSGCRIYCGIVFKASTAGVGEVCGFRLVPGVSGGTAADAAAEAQALAATADGKASKTKENFWADSGGVHVSTQANTAAGTYNSLFASTGLLFRKQSNNLVSLTQSALNFYDGAGNAEANVTGSYGADEVRIGKVGSGKFNTLIDASGIHLRSNATDMMKLAATSLDFYDTSGASMLNLTTNDANGNVRVGRADKWRALIGSSYGFQQKDPNGVSRVTSNNNGFYLRNTNATASNAVTTAELLANGTMRLGKLADYHYYGTATSLGLYPGGDNTANNALLYANNTPSVRIGAYASPHVYVNSSSFGFYPASSNTAANAYTYISAGSIRLGQQAANAKNVLMDSDGMHLRVNATSFTDFGFTPNTGNVPVDGNLVLGSNECDLTKISSHETNLGNFAGTLVEAPVVALGTGTSGGVTAAGLSLVGGTLMANLWAGTTSVTIDGANDVVNVRKNSGSGKATLKVEGTAVSLSGHTHSYLPLSGGTLTGHTELKQASGDTWLSATRTDTGVTVHLGVGQGGTNHGVYSDKLGKWLLYGSATDVFAGAINVTSAATARSSLGLDSTSSNVAAVTDLVTAATANNFTVQSCEYYTWGKLAQVYITMKSNAAITTGNKTLCTLVSGKRPKGTVPLAFASNGQYGGGSQPYLNTSGQVKLNVSTQIPSGTTIHVGGTFILP